MATTLWIIQHEHKHGHDVFHAVADGMPDPAAVVEAAGSSYEPDTAEELTISQVDLPPGSVLPTLPSGTPFILCC